MCIYIYTDVYIYIGGSAGKESTYKKKKKKSTCSAGDLGLILGLGKSPGEGTYPLQYSGLENSMDGIVHGFPKSWTQLSEFHFTDYNTKYFLK